MIFPAKSPGHWRLINLAIAMLLLVVYVPGRAQSPLNFRPNGRMDTGIVKQTYVYAKKDTVELSLDFYSKTATATGRRPCIMFLFGGAFIGGHRDDSLYNRYFDTLVKSGYDVVSISYRLGLKGAKRVSLFHTKPLEDAVNMAIDDLYDATNWVILNCDRLNIDTSKLVLSGSSSGAITVLTAAFMQSNHSWLAKKLPAGFRYAGVVAFSGAVMNLKGPFKYKSSPAPALLFHGTADKIVPYKQVRLFNKGLYGSDKIAKRYKKQHHAYYIYRETGMGHEVSVLPMFENLPVILDFLQQYVINGKKYEIDMSYNDPQAKPILTISARQLFEKLQHSSNTMVH